MIKKDAKIYIAGHRGMVGSAVWRALDKKGYTNLLGKTSTELDLRNQQAVTDFYKMVEKASEGFERLKEAKKIIGLVNDQMVNAPDTLKKEIAAIKTRLDALEAE